MLASDRNRLQHMVDAAELAIRFLAGRQRAELDTDSMLLFAVVRAIEVIGEAATHVGAETRAAAIGIPWVAITGMRNRLVHGYFDINTAIVWATATQELPALLPQLRVLIQQT